MKRMLVCTFLLLLLAVLAPFACLLLPPDAALHGTGIPSATPSPADAPNQAGAATPQPTPPGQASASFAAEAPILLWDEAQSKLLQLSVTDYLVGATACEMPVSWPEDALLAQMVACHSYALYQAARADPSVHEGACLTVNTARCSGYTDGAVLQSRWGALYDENRAKLQALAAKVSGFTLQYQGEPAAAAYHAVSCGHTEASQNVWVEALPYLQGVASPWDAYAEDYEVTVQFTPQQLKDCCSSIGITFEGEPAQWVGAVTTDEAGYVEKVVLGSGQASGVQLRSALSLRSACFALAYSGEMFSVTTKGFGHGVGLSQYGACAMAQGGTDWRQILAYYFPGTTIAEG